MRDVARLPVGITARARIHECSKATVNKASMSRQSMKAHEAKGLLRAVAKGVRGGVTGGSARGRSGTYARSYVAVESDVAKM